jgi:hypothetical protein
MIIRSGRIGSIRNCRIRLFIIMAPLTRRAERRVGSSRL